MGFCWKIGNSYAKCRNPSFFVRRKQSDSGHELKIPVQNWRKGFFSLQRSKRENWSRKLNDCEGNMKFTISFSPSQQSFIATNLPPPLALRSRTKEQQFEGGMEVTYIIDAMYMNFNLWWLFESVFAKIFTKLGRELALVMSFFL